MKFLLLSKKGKPRFSSKDPFEYANSKNLILIDDWIGYNFDLNENESEHYYAIELFPMNELRLYAMFFSKNGKKTINSDINKNASIFCRAYSNMINEVMDDIVIIIKSYNRDNHSFETFTNGDIRIIRRMLKDAIKWFS